MGPQMILVAGPYRSGTNDDPALIAKNVAAMTETSLLLFRAGHLPVMGEWYALPLIEHAGSTGIGSMKSSTQFPAASSPNAMVAFALAVRPQALTKWLLSPDGTERLCIFRWRKYQVLRSELRLYESDYGMRRATRGALACGVIDAT
jgi:hypothetical protein